MADRYFEGVGRRKTSTARARVMPGGSGNITVNNKSAADYFPREGDLTYVVSPLRATNTEKSLDVTVTVKGGGVTGQTGAVKHAIARALLKMDENMRKALRKEGLLTRDAREKERKKPGLKRARKAPTYTKR
ncbi:MAG: 30S ribosomal protein S9 [Chloroflexi bacterium]|nr:30S ribosomal protein S9 [Chloroflexota bacterium]MBI3762330.1 30S ribosomal protein S9 [Chloroflexota bacterium]